MKRQLPVLLACALCGALFVGAAYWALLSLGQPELSLRLVPVTAGDRTKVVLRFANPGKRDVALHVGGMEYFVFVPADDSRKYIVHVYDKNRRAGPGSAAAPGKIAVLEPGKSIDVGDVSLGIRQLPAGKGMLKAVYSVPGTAFAQSQVWTGVVHSPYMTLDVTRN